MATEQTSIDTAELRDEKGRPRVTSMTDRALLEEMTLNMRASADAILAIQQEVKGGGLLKMFMGNGKR